MFIATGHQPIWGSVGARCLTLDIALLADLWSNPFLYYQD
jgi:hypothetical protein